MWIVAKIQIKNTYETNDDYVIFDEQTQNYTIVDKPRIQKANIENSYSSDKVELFSKQELKDIIKMKICFQRIN